MNNKIYVCAFCGKLMREENGACCGEVGRGEWVDQEPTEEKPHQESASDFFAVRGE